MKSIIHYILVSLGYSLFLHTLSSLLTATGYLAFRDFLYSSPSIVNILFVIVIPLLIFFQILKKGKSKTWALLFFMIISSGFILNSQATKNLVFIDSTSEFLTDCTNKLIYEGDIFNKNIRTPKTCGAVENVLRYPLDNLKGLLKFIVWDYLWYIMISLVPYSISTFIINKLRKIKNVE